MRTTLDIPRDGRIRLSFDLSWLQKFAENSGKNLKLMTQTVEDFHDKLLKLGTSVDFCILDSNTRDSDPVLAIYRPLSHNFVVNRDKDKSVRGKPETPESSNDQWERVIFCQGLSLVRNSEATVPDRPFSFLPYLIVEGQENPINNMVKLHLDCSRRLGSELANPYRDDDNGFHITFYEKVESLPNGESWKTGRLYEKAADPRDPKQSFRQSAFTMFATSKDLKSAPTSSGLRPSQNAKRQDSEHDWTILLLTPSAFFKAPRGPAQIDLVWTEIGKHRFKEIAELTIIVYALEAVVKRWADLYQHIESLLHEDFMEPEVYVELLFDDENFSQSRLYFWVIGCLNEFDISIEDNIKQWALFREARVTPFLEEDLRNTSQDGGSSPNTGIMNYHQQLQDLAEEVDGLCEALKNRQLRFEHQRKTVLALRDGLFNASALMESRASTRLGRNVKLLTYVSIFYLPLAFCAALWAIPNITDRGIRNPFITTAVIVGFVTYIIVFNLGNIASHCGRLYEPYRSGVVKLMVAQSISDDTGRRIKSKWEKRVKRFQSSFGPKKADGEPSEWWILIYSVKLVLEWLFVSPKEWFQRIVSFSNFFAILRRERGAQQTSGGGETA